MRKVAVLTDSACDISPELQQKYGIDILPFYIAVDGKSYTEREDFTNEEYYEMLTKCEGIPVTSQITPMRFLEQFAHYDEQGYTDVLYVAINSTGSNTYQNAVFASRQYREEHPDSQLKFHIVDSHT